MKKFLGLLAMPFLLTFLAPTVQAGTYSFANTNFITINDSFSPPTIASPYPSGINVFGIPANEKVDKVTVRLHNLSHGYSSDMDILLAGPTSRSLLLVSDVGGGTSVSGATVTLDDEASAGFPAAFIVPGIFRPTNLADGIGSDAIPAPAPAPSAVNLAVFKGSNPNGVWNLFVVDDSSGAGGSMAGGWSLNIKTTAFFTNSTFIKINDTNSVTLGKASPYPASITVSGLTGSVVKVTAKLNGFEHTYPADVDILLVSPAGTNLVLMSDAGADTAVTNLNFTFDDFSPVQMPDGPLTTGTFRPSNYNTAPPDNFPSPAPAPSSATNLSIFNGKNPNGIWSIYIVDDGVNDDGQIANGWSLSITTDMAPVIINPGVVGSQFKFTWFGLQGVLYQVQRTSNLSSPSWTTEVSVIGNDALKSYFFSINSSSPQFFRVVIPAVVSPAP